MKVAAQGIVAGPASVTWGRFMAFGDIAQWHPLIARSSLEDAPGPGGGIVRALTTHDAAAIREELVACDPAARRLTYTFLNSPFPVSDYRATVEVSETEIPGSCQVTWTATFEPDDPADGPRLRALFANDVFQTGIDALRTQSERPETAATP